MMKLGSSTKINNVPQNLQPFRPSDMNFPCLNQLKMIVVRWESQIIYKTFCLLDNVVKYITFLATRSIVFNERLILRTSLVCYFFDKIDQSSSLFRSLFGLEGLGFLILNAIKFLKDSSVQSSKMFNHVKKALNKSLLIKKNPFQYQIHDISVKCSLFVNK